MCGQYAGVFDAMTSIYKDGGINALFVGSAARYQRTPCLYPEPFAPLLLDIIDIVFVAHRRQGGVVAAVHDHLPRRVRGVQAPATHVQEGPGRKKGFVKSPFIVSML
jgi:hypothetical protein